MSLISSQGQRDRKNCRELDEGVQSLAGSRQRPIYDHFKFGLRRAVTVAGQIMANALHAHFEKIAFAQF